MKKEEIEQISLELYNFLSKLNLDKTTISLFPRMYDKERDQINIPLIINNKKIIIEIK